MAAICPAMKQGILLLTSAALSVLFSSVEKVVTSLQ